MPLEILEGGRAYEVKHHIVKIVIEKVTSLNAAIADNIFYRELRNAKLER